MRTGCPQSFHMTPSSDCIAIRSDARSRSSEEKLTRGMVSYTSSSTAFPSSGLPMSRPQHLEEGDQVRKPFARDLPQGAGARHEHQRVPQGAPRVEPGRFRRRRFLDEGLDGEHALCDGCRPRSSDGTIQPYSSSMSVGRGSQQDDPIPESLRGLDRHLHLRHEPPFGVHEMIRRQEDHDGIGVAVHGVHQPQEHAGRRVQVGRLLDERAVRRTRLARAEHVPVVPPDDSQDAARVAQARGAIEGVVEHRSRAGERAVLLGNVTAEPALGQRPQTHTIAAGQHDYHRL